MTVDRNAGATMDGHKFYYGECRQCGCLYRHWRKRTTRERPYDCSAHLAAQKFRKTGQLILDL